MENNRNEANIIPNMPIEKERPQVSQVSPEILNLSRQIQGRAGVDLSKHTNQIYDLDLNSVLDQPDPNKIKLNKFDVGRDAYTELNDGTLIRKYDKYIPGIDNAELLAKNQTTGEKWSNGLTKFLGKTAVNILGGTVGTVDGLINGISNQSLAAVYNNDFSRYLDDLNTRMDNKLPNYYTAQERDMNFGQKLGTANFWANDAMGGLSFLTGTIVSEGIWAAATGGTSLIAKGALGTASRITSKMLGREAMFTLNAVKKEGGSMIRASVSGSTDDMVKAGIKADRATEFAKTTRFLYTSAGYEAGVEARHFMTETEAEWKDNFQSQYGRRPTIQEQEEFKNDLTNTANTLFAANVGLVGTSNLTVIGNIFLNKAPSKYISNNVFKKVFLGLGYKKTKDKTIKTLTANTAQKVAGKSYSILKAPFTEGFVEEGGQAVLSTASKDYMMSAYDKDNTKDSLSIVDSLIEGFKYAYTTKEGLTEVGLGAIIGALGGAVSTKGRFNEVAQERELIEDVAAYANQFTVNNLVENLKFGNKIRQATIQGEQARAEGNLTNEMRADKAAMTAVAERAYHYENKADTILDFNAAIDSMEDSKLAETYELSKEEVAEWKAAKKAEFAEVIETHTRNLQFAEALVGRTPLAGLNKIEGFTEQNIGDLRGAIAYTLTMGSESSNFAEALQNQIKLNIAKELSLDGNLDAFTVNEVLRQVDTTKLNDYKRLSNKAAQLQRKLNNLSKAKVEADNAVAAGNKENNTKAVERLHRIQEQLTKTQEAVAQLEMEKSTAFAALNIPQLTDEMVTEEMLDNQETSVKALMDTMESISRRDPQRGELIQQLYTEYGRAVENSRMYDRLVGALLNPETRLHTLNGWLGSLINRKKEVNGDTAQLFKDLVGTFVSEGHGVNGIGVKGNKKNVPTQEEELEEENKEEDVETKEETREDKELKDPLEEAPETITPPTPPVTQDKVANVKEVIKKLKEQVKDLITRNAYTNLEYVGKDFDYEGVLPTQEEIDRYNELLGKISKGSNITTILARPFNRKNPRGLSEAETAELHQLNEKLNQWKVLTGLNNENKESVAEKLQLIHQLEQEYNLVPTKITIEANEIPTSSEVSATKTKDSLVTIVTPDNVVAKKNKKTKKYEISHLNALSLLKLFPNSRLFLMQDGQKVDVTTVPVEVITELQKQSGVKFILQTQDSSGEVNLEVEVDERQRLIVDAAQLEALIPESNFRILNVGKSNYMPLFIKNGDTYIPLEGDFKIESINDNEVIVLDSERLYELEPGAVLRTVVNLNDRYNAKLLQEYRLGNITREELENELHIYVSPQGSANNIVGSVRAIKPSSNKDTEAYAKVRLLRKLATNKALKSKTPRVEVGISLPLQMVIMGSPNMEVKETDGVLESVNKELTPEALDKIEAYGYMQDGELFLNKNLDNTKKDTTFAESVSNRSKNKGAKIPVIVFRYKNTVVVYPTSLNSTEGNQADKALEILNESNTSPTAKVIKLNELALESKLDPTQYAIVDLNSVEEINRMLDDLSKVPAVVNVETWLEEGHNKADLINEVRINIDITGKPFHAPKGVMDYSGVSMPNEDSLRIEAVESLSNLAQLVDDIFIAKEPFREMKTDWAFYTAFYEDHIVRDRPEYMYKAKNVRILKDAFAQTMPGAVREALGEDLIKQIKSEIKQYNLIESGVKTNIEVLYKELGLEVDAVKNGCKTA